MSTRLPRSMSYVLLAPLLLALGFAVSRVPLGGSGFEEQVLLGVLATLAVAAVSAVALVLPSTLSKPPPLWLAATPTVLTAALMSFAATGVGGALPHQIVWPLVALAFGGFALTADRTFTLPLWLIVFAVAGLTIDALTGASWTAVAEHALAALVLGGSWLAASRYSMAGGTMRYLEIVAGIFWGLFVLAVLLRYSGANVGSMGPSTITLPWQTSLNANYQGYGAVTVQGARELALIVAVFHLVRGRFARDPRHLLAGAVALLFFASFYGRVPFIGGIVALAVLFATFRRGTNIPIAIAAAVFLAVFGLGAGGLVDLRFGETGWDSGHLALWVQHLSLFGHSPWTGVGASASWPDVIQASQYPLTYVESGAGGLQLTDLLERGSRGEGGWTGLLAQQGIVTGGIILSLVTIAAVSIWRKLPTDRTAFQDAVALRALIPATLVWYVTDAAPAGFFTLSGFVATQLTLVAVAREIRARRSS